MNKFLQASEQPDYVQYLECVFYEWISKRSQSAVLKRSERALKKESERIYQEMWLAFALFCAQKSCRLEAITSAQITEFLAARAEGTMHGMPRVIARGSKLTPRYTWRMLTLIDKITAFHASQHALAKNNAAQEVLADPRYRYANAADNDGLPEYFRPQEVERLIEFLHRAPNQTKTSAQSWKAERDRTAVALMLGAGLTPGEVRGLAVAGVVDDMFAARQTPSVLLVPGNGNAPQREVRLSGWVSQMLARWLVTRTRAKLHGERLFPSTSQGKPWSHTGCYESCRALLQEAGLGEKSGGVFRLRHTYALRELANGVSESDVARQLGLLDPGSMARYLQVRKTYGLQPNI